MAKGEHLFRNSIKSFFESHTDPKKHEELKSTRKDMEEKKNEILKIVQNEDKDETKSGPLAELIEDFHKQYESLYAHYNHLTGELKNKVHTQGNENSSSSSESNSDSDSDSDSNSDRSHKKKGTKNRKQLGDGILKPTNGLNQELEAAKLEVTLLENKLEVVSNEKETLESAYDAIMSKLESTEKTVEELKVETLALKSEKSNLLAEKKDLDSRLEDSVKKEVELKQQIEQLIRDKDDLATEREDANNLKMKLDLAKEETGKLEESLKATEEENESLSTKISDIADELLRAQKTIEEIRKDSTNSNEKLVAREQELSSLQQIHNAYIAATSDQIKELEERNSNLKLELDVVTRERNEMEERYTSTMIEIGKMTEELSEFRAQVSSLENKLEVNENESNATIEGLTVKVNGFAQALDKLHSEKNQLEEQLKELEDASNRKSEELAGHLHESREDLEAVQSPTAAQSPTAKLMQQLAMTYEPKDESFVELERTIKNLKRKVQVAQDEAYTASEKNGKMEVKLRLSNQKLRVTEQLLAEKEQDYRTAKKEFDEECKLLKDMNCRLSRALAANDKAYSGMIMNMSENMNDLVAGMESNTKKFEEDNERFSSRIYSISEEIQILRNCVAGDVERKKLQEQLRNLNEELQNEREHRLMLKRELSELEVEAEKEKEKLVGALTELKKTTEELSELLKKKDEQVIILEDEKREAIRQLCLWSDDKLSQYDELKNKIAKLSLLKR